MRTAVQVAGRVTHSLGCGLVVWQEGDCYHGYTRATYGCVDASYVDSFGALTHWPKGRQKLR